MKRFVRIFSASWSRALPALLTALLLTALAPELAGAAQDLTLPSMQLTLSGGASEPGKVSVLLEILFLLTVLSVAPSIMLTVTSFTRIIIVFSFLRQEALQPYLQEQIDYRVALDRAQAPLREFMFKHTREKDISVFYAISRMDAPNNKDEVPTIMLAAAFVISELKTAFTIGFLIYIPFLVLDMVISSVLLAMGMMMLPPMMVSMPFKLLLFVMVDGWNLLVGSLVNSFLL